MQKGASAERRREEKKRKAPSTLSPSAAFIPDLTMTRESSSSESIFASRDLRMLGLTNAKPLGETGEEIRSRSGC